MIDSYLLLSNPWSANVSNSGVSNADLIASQTAQNNIYLAILIIIAGVFGFMFKQIADGFKEAREERTLGFKEASQERQSIRTDLIQIKQLLIYTKAAEQGVPPEQVEREVSEAARREIEADPE